MKILFLNHNYLGYGTYWRCLNLGKALARRGHQVVMVTSSDQDFDLRIRRQKVEKGLELLILPRIRLSQYHTGHTLRMILNTLIVLFADYDFCHVFVFPVHPMAIPAVVAKLIRRKPLIIDGDDLWRGGWADYHPWFIKKQLEFCEDKLGFLADKITVVSDLMRKRFLDMGISEEKIAYLPNGASVSEIKPLEKEAVRVKLGLESRSPLVLVMGHTYTEGLFIFLRAFAKVAKKLVSAKLLFLGKMAISDEDQKRLEKTIALFKDKIIFKGERPFNEVSLYLSAADVLVLPMDNNLIEEARFPMRFGDYLCSGRPIVSNAVGEIRKILLKHECGLVCPPENEKQFAKNILTVLKDEKLAKKLGDHGRLTAEKILAWPLLAEKLEKIYHGI